MPSLVYPGKCPWLTSTLYWITEEELVDRSINHWCCMMCILTWIDKTYINRPTNSAALLVVLFPIIVFVEPVTQHKTMLSYYPAAKQLQCLSVLALLAWFMGLIFLFQSLARRAIGIRKGLSTFLKIHWNVTIGQVWAFTLAFCKCLTWARSATSKNTAACLVLMFLQGSLVCEGHRQTPKRTVTPPPHLQVQE